MSNPHTVAHRRQIERVLADIPGTQTSGFWREHDRVCREAGAEPTRFPFTPDAFRFNADEHEIGIYEVEVSSPLTAGKIAYLGELWEWWDGEGEVDWLPVLILIDRFGNRSRMDLRHAAYGTGWAQNIVEAPA